MAEAGYIASALLTGIVLIALVAMLARVRQWRSSPTGVVRTGGRGDGGFAAAATELARTPLAWTVGFLVLVFAVGAAAVAFVAGPAVPAAVAQGAGVALTIAFASVLGAYLFWGVYHSARYRELPDAQATLMGLWVLGFLLIAAVVVKLLMAG